MKFLVLHAFCTFNNTIITLTDLKGSVIDWSSSGRSGFKGTKKSSTYSSQVSVEYICKKIVNLGILNLKVRIKGFGPGRDVVFRTLNNMGINIISISDVTPIPHNGCRPPKKRRI
ncbi:30S ribosomal protein S11 [Candidatus Vidania fulgoroideorum]